MSKFIKLLFIALLILLTSTSVYAELLDSWEDQEAYKPMPILFLHGFALGSPDSWDDLVSYLAPYYQPYQNITPALSDSRSYMERIDFQDPNGSVDRYDPGEFNPQGNSAGWADKVDIAVDDMLENFHYGSYSDKVILIAHSMGGLAAREYITTGGAGNVEKLITLNTPHAGTTLGNIAQDVNKTRALGWKIPVIGWLYSAELAQVDRTFNFLLNVDIDGEAAEDTAIGSDFLTELNVRFQPDIPSYTISAYAWAIRNYFAFHLYYPNSRTAISPWYAGDGVVPIDSQEGFDVITNPGEVREVWHFNDKERVSGNHFVTLRSDSVAQRILQWIDSERPEVEITGVKVSVEGVEQDAPFEGSVYRINSSSCILEGSITREFFPANTTLNITIQREGEGPQVIVNGPELLPDNSWIPGNPASVVAGFRKIINFPRPGIYEVTTKVINPARRESEELVIVIEAEFNQPIIEPISPQPGWTIADRRPTIQARIYSPPVGEFEGFDIDLDSVEMRLDGVVVSHVNNPPEGGPDIIISYTPTSDLAYGTHTVTVNASDITGTPADEVSWAFVIAQPELTVEPIYPRQGQRIIYRTPNIRARIYSNISGYIIYLNFIEMRLDGTIVSHTLYPSSVGPEIFISYTPIDELDIGLHTVTVSASDENGLSSEETWTFSILDRDTIDVTFFNVYAEFGGEGQTTSRKLTKSMLHEQTWSTEENYAAVRSLPASTTILRHGFHEGSAGQGIADGCWCLGGVFNNIYRTIYPFDTSTLPDGEIVHVEMYLGTVALHSGEDDGLKLYLWNGGGLDEWSSGEDLIAFLDSSYFDVNRVFAINSDVINRSGLTQIMFVTLKEDHAIMPPRPSHEYVNIHDDINFLRIGIIVTE